MNFTPLTEFIDSLPGAGIPFADCTVYHEGNVVYRHGVSSEHAVYSETAQYYMYSCSKVITCTAALQLFEHGKFLLDTPVCEFLPEFSEMRVKCDGYYLPAERKITMLDLFTMCSGLSYNLTHAYIQEMAERTGGECPTREAVKAIAKMPLVCQPGERFNYGLSHDVLAAVVAEISGMSFSEYVEKNIFLPLGMTNSTFDPQKTDKSKLAPLFAFDDKTNAPLSAPLSNMYILGCRYESGGAGLVSNVSDMLRFAAAMCGDKIARSVGQGGKTRVLSPAATSLMRTDFLTSAQKKGFKWAAFGDCYGYGLGVRTLINRRGGALSGEGEFGWQGAAGAYMLMDPDRELALFYAQHMLHNKEAYVHPRLRNILYGIFDRA